MAGKLLNLEPICARYGHQMVSAEKTNNKAYPKFEDQDNTITKALGVLVESGLYALCVFLISCNKKEYGTRILTESIRPLWQEDGIGLMPKDVGDKPAEILKAVRKIAEDLPRLILARKITEQALTFARYHAKAKTPSN